MAEDTSESGESKSSGSMGKLLIWLVVVVMAIGGGLATPLLIAQLSAEPAEVEPEKREEPDPDEEVDFIEFDEITVNLDEARFSRFLRMKFALQVAKSEKEEIQKIIDAKSLIFKNWLHVNMSEKSSEDLRGKFGRNRVSREILDFLNQTLFDDGYERIRAVLFEVFVVQ
ncbi:MAG: flagellar basal body-associated protein FliL [Mariniblastus sp.]